jgi:hypothetical protein
LSLKSSDEVNKCKPLCNGHPFFGENALRLEANPGEEATQDGFLGGGLYKLNPVDP